jgi:hypothetical protein
MAYQLCVLDFDRIRRPAPSIVGITCNNPRQIADESQIISSHIQIIIFGYTVPSGKMINWSLITRRLGGLQEFLASAEE